MHWLEEELDEVSLDERIHVGCSMNRDVSVTMINSTVKSHIK